MSFVVAPSAAAPASAPGAEEDGADGRARGRVVSRARRRRWFIRRARWNARDPWPRDPHYADRAGLLVPLGNQHGPHAAGARRARAHLCRARAAAALARERMGARA